MVFDRWEKLRKTERNEKLLEYIEKHPEKTLEEIGELFDISKQRVWEIQQLAAEKKKGAAVDDSAAPARR